MNLKETNDFNPNLGEEWWGGGGNFAPTPYWFSLNNSETVKAVTPEFCSVEQQLIRDIRAKFGIPDLPNFPDIKQNPDEGIDFQVSGQSFLNGNCHNSRTSHDIDMKLQPVTKLDKRNTTTSKKLSDDVMLTNRKVIVFFSIQVQFSAIRKPDCRRMVYKT